MTFHGNANQGKSSKPKMECVNGYLPTSLLLNIAGGIGFVPKPGCLKQGSALNETLGVFALPWDDVHCGNFMQAWLVEKLAKQSKCNLEVKHKDLSAVFTWQTSYFAKREKIALEFKVFYLVHIAEHTSTKTKSEDSLLLKRQLMASDTGVKTIAKQKLMISLQFFKAKGN